MVFASPAGSRDDGVYRPAGVLLQSSSSPALLDCRAPTVGRAPRQVRRSNRKASTEERPTFTRPPAGQMCSRPDADAPHPGRLGEDAGMEVLSSRILLRPSDSARSQAFYGDVLGLAVYRQFGPPERPGLVFFLGNG